MRTRCGRLPGVIRRSGWHRSIARILVVATAVTAGLAGVGGSPAVAQTEPAGTHAVGAIERSFVDSARPTARNAACAKLPTRTLPTTILYPAVGDPSGEAQPDAAPDSSGGPYPLVVFAHGYSASADAYRDLLAHWASAGYVVAAPTFPLTSADSPCGAIAGDVVNQPEDLSFVIDSVLAEAKQADGPLAGLIDRKKIGAAGHSNGAITTYGLVANSEVRDRRVKAAAIMAGTAQKYPRGRYDFASAPPVLLVHGTDDTLVPYNAALEGFNRFRGPKGLLSIEGGDHGSSSGAAAFAATTDFFDAYLRGDEAAKQRLPNDQVPGQTTMKFDDQPGSTSTLPTLPEEELDLEASVSPRKGLSGGQIVTVSWSGYSKGKVVNILQCNASDRDLTKSSECDYSKAVLLHPNPTGDGSAELEIVEGPVGTGVCDADHQGCFIVVNNASSTDPKDSVIVDIRFKKK